MNNADQLTSTRYNHKQLRELFERDPVEFDRYAAEAIRMACIGKTPEESKKLQQMQWVIESHLRKGKTPLEKMHIMEHLFYNRVYDTDGLIHKLNSSLRDLAKYLRKNFAPVQPEAAPLRLRMVKGGRQDMPS